MGENVIRDFKPGDGKRCFEIFKAGVERDPYIPEATKKEMLKIDSPQSFEERAQQFHIVVYEENGRIISMGGLDKNEIRGMFVDPEYQGRGIGRAIIQYLEALIPRDKYSYIFLNSTRIAEQFYVRMGYAAKGKRVFELNGQPLETIYMEKAIE
ncbi:MAG: GNAT family N-acetyltransferase [Candidatus Aminicenantia bacterium]